MVRRMEIGTTRKIGLVVGVAFAILTTLMACDAADGLVGIHTAFLPGFNQVPAPTVSAASSSVEVGDSTALTASGSGTDAVYNWSIVAGGGAVDSVGETVSFTASDTPETVTISVYASVTGFQDSESVEIDILVSDLPFLDAPSVSFDEGTNRVFINDTANLSASGSGSGVTYNWTVTGTGSIGSTGDIVAYSAPSAEETATVSVYASAAGFNDSPATDATLTVQANHFALLRFTNGSFNLNQSTTISWSTSTMDSAYFDNSTPTQLKALQDGDYFLALTIPMFNDAVQRTAVRAQIWAGPPGSLVAVDGAVADSSYIRNSGHEESSDHLAILLDGLSANDVIEVRLTAAALAGSVTLTDQATLYAEYVAPARTVFSATSVTTTAGTDLNQVGGNPLVWSSVVADGGFTHAGTESITLDSAGYYLVYANLPTTYLSGTLDRYSIEMQVKLAGATVTGGIARQGYIRNASSHNSASVHFSGLVYSPDPNGVLTVTAGRQAGMSTGVVNVGANEATIFIERLDPSAFVYSGTASDPVSGTEWNSGSELNIAWSNGDILMDDQTFSHSASAQPDVITFDKAGEYLLIYNDVLEFAGTSERMNPKIQVCLGGSPVLGAQTKTHYIRNYVAMHEGSSASLVFYLQGVSAGESLTVRTVQEAIASAGGFVESADDALLTIIRKQ